LQVQRRTSSSAERTRPEATISLEKARKLNLIKQHLVANRSSSNKPTRRDILNVLKSIRYLQIDPTNIVCKSHLLVLWSRLGNYDAKLLEGMLWKERTLFEYWAHGAAIGLSEDYPLFKLGMKTIVSDITTYQKRAEDWYKSNKKLAEYIENELSTRGPLASNEFEDASEKSWKSSGWSNERNVGKMLEILHKRGEILVHSRANGGQKKWDLFAKYLEFFPKDEYSDDEEIIGTGLEISLRAMGVATALQMRDYFHPGSRLTETVLRIVSEMKDEGVIVPLEITGIPTGKTGEWFIHREDMKLLDNLERYWKPKTTLLSPFDNLIYDRVRTSYFFWFKVIFEAYVPKDKRIYGYYVLPILHGDKLVGRIDPEMDRINKVLRVNSIHLEKGVGETSELTEAVSDSIKELATFLGAERIGTGDRVGSKWKRTLPNAI
jgi:uncharacterized protein